MLNLKMSQSFFFKGLKIKIRDRANRFVYTTETS